MRGPLIASHKARWHSPAFPGAYAIVEGGKVRRVTVGERSDVKLVEGIGTGATEAAVRAAFPGFREEPHKYGAAPAKYLDEARHDLVAGHRQVAGPGSHD